MNQTLQLGGLHSYFVVVRSHVQISAVLAKFFCGVPQENAMIVPSALKMEIHSSILVITSKTMQCHNPKMTVHIFASKFCMNSLSLHSSYMPRPL